MTSARVLILTWFGRGWSTFCENHWKSALKWPSNYEKCSDCGKNRREGRPYRLLQESIWFLGISSEVWPILSEEGRKNRVENEKSGVCVTVYISTTVIATEKRISNSESWENFKDPLSKMIFREINVFRVKFRLESSQFDDYLLFRRKKRILLRSVKILFTILTFFIFFHWLSDLRVLSTYFGQNAPKWRKLGPKKLKTRWKLFKK